MHVYFDYRFKEHYFSSFNNIPTMMRIFFDKG